MKRIRSGLITDSTKLYNIILIRFRNMKKGKITAKIPVKSRTSGRIFRIDQVAVQRSALHRPTIQERGFLNEKLVFLSSPFSKNKMFIQKYSIFKMDNETSASYDLIMLPVSLPVIRTGYISYSKIASGQSARTVNSKRDLYLKN